MAVVITKDTKGTKDTKEIKEKKGRRAALLLVAVLTLPAVGCAEASFSKVTAQQGRTHPETLNGDNDGEDACDPRPRAAGWSHAMLLLR